MGQACCISTERGAFITEGNGALFDYWKLTVKAILDFDEKDKVVNRWREFEILILQVRKLLFNAHIFV